MEEQEVEPAPQRLADILRLGPSNELIEPAMAPWPPEPNRISTASAGIQRGALLGAAAGTTPTFIFLVQFNTETLAQPWLKAYEPRGFWPPIHLENCWLHR